MTLSNHRRRLLPAFAVLSLVLSAACDGGDDTVTPGPTKPRGGNGGASAGASGKAGAGASLAGAAGAAGVAGVSGGASGSAGSPVGTGGSGAGGGASGAAGGPAGAGGQVGGSGGAAGGSGNGGAAAAGAAGQGGGSGAGGASGGSAGAAGASGGAGAGGAALPSYDAACAKLEADLLACGKPADEAKQAAALCVGTQSCTQSIMYPGTPEGIMGCFGKACVTPTNDLNAGGSIFGGCIDGVYVDESKVAGKNFSNAVKQKADQCESMVGPEPEKGMVVKRLKRQATLVAGYYSLGFYSTLTACLQLECKAASNCLLKTVNNACGSSAWIWNKHESYSFDAPL